MLIGGGLLAYNMLVKSRALGTMNFYPDKVRNIEFDGVTPVMTIGLVAQNTSNQQLVLRSIAGNLFCNNFLIGNVSSFTPVVIRPNSQGIIFLNVRLSLLGIVNDIVKAFQTGSFAQEVEMQAYANVDNFQIPVKIKYKIGLNS